MNNLPKYPAYKPSGVEWLGEIPEHWEVKKLKFLGNIFPGLNGKKGDDFSKEYSSGLKPFIPFTNICNNLKISNEHFQYVRVSETENQNRIKKNDILFLMSSETFEDIAKCSIYLGNSEELYLNSFCKGFRISKNFMNPEFVNYLLFSSTYRNYFSNAGRGFTRINLKQEFINDVYTLIPKLEEQTAIASFLDRKTAQIDQAIGIKEKQIELLKERRQILIHRAVTRGLDPNAKLKDSGVKWIGEIPEHWEVVRSKTLFTERKERARENDVQLTSSQKFGVIPQHEYMAIEGRRVTQVEFNREIQKHVEKGDFMISMRSFQGGIEYSEYEGCISSAYVSLIPCDYIEPKYYKNLLKCYRYIEALQSTSNLVRDGQALRYDNFKQVDLLKIPKEEQIAISSFIEKNTTKIATAISLKEQEIERLKEYKTSLVDAAVTGKIKVG